MAEIGKTLVAIGTIFLLVGVLMWLSGDVLKYLPLGRLPGDIAIERENFTFYFPLTTCILLSLGLSVLFWLGKSLFR